MNINESILKLRIPAKFKCLPQYFQTERRQEHESSSNYKIFIRLVFPYIIVLVKGMRGQNQAYTAR